MARTRLYNSPRLQMIGRLTGSLVDLVFPPKCRLCYEVMTEPLNEFCSTCLSELAEQWDEPSCPRCAASVAPFEIARDKKGRMGCGQCRDESLKIDNTVRLGAYQDGLGHLVRQFKYRGREELGPTLGKWLSQIVQHVDWLDRVEAVVSVPTHWKHRLSRPLHAADKLAAVIADRLDVPHVPILRRVRAGPHQINLSANQRIANVRGAFAMQRGVTLRDTHVLLIDDVKTTGATLEECAKVLRQAGAAEIYAAVLVKVNWVE